MYLFFHLRYHYSQGLDSYCDQCMRSKEHLTGYLSEMYVSESDMTGQYRCGQMTYRESGPVRILWNCNLKQDM